MLAATAILFFIHTSPFWHAMAFLILPGTKALIRCLRCRWRYSWLLTLKKKLWPYVWQVAWKDFQVFACTRSPIVGPSLGFLCTRIVFIINPLHLLFFNSQRGKRKTGDLHHYPSLWQLDLARLPYAFFFPSALVCMIFSPLLKSFTSAWVRMLSRLA